LVGSTPGNNKNIQSNRINYQLYLFSQFLPVEVGTPDAHVDAVEEVVRAVDIESIVQLLQVGVVHDLVGVGDVLLDGAQLVVGANFGLRVHP